jgi:uncharacterized protein
MIDRIQVLIKQLELQPHPEGGYYREAFRSERLVKPMDQRAERNALTAIYFLLPAGQCSRWHCVLSDEIWCHLEGAPLELFCWDAQAAQMTRTLLGEYSPSGVVPMHAVPAGVWQAAEPKGEYALIGCYVGPGFTFTDFRLAADVPEMAQSIQRLGLEFKRML